ncbi:MAG: class II D-tagatose-bisphosphate aldolase, non-catalytic subunit [Clostridiales bacterium]|nr:class II D-tagatose-bisphosphate aldolase, non-catalytic subunit [Clostridiales bacterium]
MHQLQELLNNRKKGAHSGVYSCCSANRYVITAVMQKALETNTLAIVESTANQVDHLGGYTGMTPSMFHDFVFEIACETGLPSDRVMLGGDHLGPLTFAHLPQQEAMEEAQKLITAYIQAGYSKIHIDTSMHIGSDDMSLRLSDETIAHRSAALCRTAENAFARLASNNNSAQPPVYIIGSEVPIPGGETAPQANICVTSPDDVVATINSFDQAFHAERLDRAWQRVVAIVVQPGVEFGDNGIFEYNSAAARPLMNVLNRYPQFVFEGHSTDYQPRESLRNMVRDGVAILKVGPALTFALREGLFALELIEQELVEKDKRSHFRTILEQAMIENPSFWEKHYRGTPEELRFKRAFSISDRARYYQPVPIVETAAQKLLENLDRVEIPRPLISQFLPMELARTQNERLNATSLLTAHIGTYIDDYLYAIQA